MRNVLAPIFRLNLILAVSASCFNSPAFADMTCAKPDSALFGEDESLLNLNFYADHASIHDQKENALTHTPGIIEYSTGGQRKMVAAEFRARGNSRIQCRPKPLKIIFEDETFIGSLGAAVEPQFALNRLIEETNKRGPLVGVSQKNNLFAGVGNDVKMVNECEPFADRTWPGSKDPLARQAMLLNEFYIYRMLELLSSPSLAVRLARVRYLDRNSASYWFGYSFFLEPLGKARKRCGLTKVDYVEVSKLNARSVFETNLFQRFIGNHDYRADGAHNIEYGIDDSGSLHVIPFDFDEADLVKAHDPHQFEEGDRDLKYFVSLALKNDAGGANKSSIRKLTLQAERILDLYEQSELDADSKKTVLIGLKRRFAILDSSLSK